MQPHAEGRIGAAISFVVQEGRWGTHPITSPGRISPISLTSPFLPFLLQENQAAGSLVQSWAATLQPWRAGDTPRPVCLDRAGFTSGHNNHTVPWPRRATPLGQSIRAVGNPGENQIVLAWRGLGLQALPGTAEGGERVMLFLPRGL